MKLKCEHGFFMFEETAVGQVSDYMSRTGFDLVPKAGYFTFAALEDAPSYSIAGAPLLGTTAVATFAGEPWEVFEANAFVFNFSTGLVVPIALITQATQIRQAGEYFVAAGGGLILPGSITSSGRIKGFSGWYSRERLSWLYSEVSYV